MDDCPESLDGESMSCDADDIASNLDLVELEPKTLSCPQTSGGGNRDDDLGSLSSGSSCHRSSRELRNLAEKKRRDTLNTHINELSTLVPMVASSTKKMDKTSVLRLSATYIRMSKTLIPDKNWPNLSAFLDSVNLSRALMEHMEGFLLIVTAAARIIFVSHTIEEYLGHSQNDLMGQDLYSIVHEDDRDELKRNLTPDGGFPCCPGGDGHDGDDSSSSESVTSCSSGQSSPGPPPDIPSSTSGESVRDTPMERQRRSFYLRMSPKGTSRADQREYENVHIMGVLRVPARLEVNIPPTRSRRNKDCRYNENDITLVAMGRLYKGRSVSDLSILEATKEEYITRHEPTGRMIYIDHRVSFVAGYLSEEVMGRSAFNFMHRDDIPWTMIALKKMYDSGGFGNSTYRLRAKNGTYVYLRSCGYLEYDHTSQAVQSFVCVNTLISEEEGEKEIEDMKKKYSPHFVDVQNSMPLVAALDPANAEYSIQKIYERIVAPSTGDHVSSSTEVATRPTVLREVTSVHRVTSSSGERIAVKRIIEEKPRPTKVRRKSPTYTDISVPSHSQDLDLDLSVQPITQGSNSIPVSSFRTVSWKKELSGTMELHSKQHLPSQTVKAPKTPKHSIKAATQVQQEMEHILCKGKRGMSNVSV